MREIANQIAESLDGNFLPAWFPRCIDPAGGFHQNFGPAWEPKGDGSRFLVYQSRITWLAATLVGTGRTQYRRVARHGLRFLADHLFDRSVGAFHWNLDSHRCPTSQQRVVYGIAFALFALSAVARHLADEEALDLAKRTFDWLDRHHYDDRNGGYREVADLQGNLLLDPEAKDAIGTPAHRRSQNTNLHLLEAFSELHEVWPDGLVHSRLGEVLTRILNGFYADPGRLHLYCEEDWQPVDGGVSFGHDVEAAHLAIVAARELKLWPHMEVEAKARALVDNALKHGWDENLGGFYLSGLWGGEADNKSKNWWTQAEGLLALATLACQFPGGGYDAALAKQWEFVRRFQIDDRHGGWRETVDVLGKPIQNLDKAHAWKAAYHDGRALLFSHALLNSASGSAL